MTDETKKRSKKKPWFKRGERVIWSAEEGDPEPLRGTIKEVFKKVGSKLYTLAWVSWDLRPGDRELINIEWLDPEPPLDTLARIMPYKTGQRVKLVKHLTWIDTDGSECTAPAGSVGIVVSVKRRRNRQPAIEVAFDFLGKGSCLVMYRSQVAPAE